RFENAVRGRRRSLTASGVRARPFALAYPSYCIVDIRRGGFPIASSCPIRRHDASGVSGNGVADANWRFPAVYLHVHQRLEGQAKGGGFGGPERHAVLPCVQHRADSGGQKHLAVRREIGARNGCNDRFWSAAVCARTCKVKRGCEGSPACFRGCRGGLRCEQNVYSTELN